MCQIQYNFMDVSHQGGREGLAYAASRGLGVVVMDPLRGGQLAQPLPPAVEAVWNRSAIRTSTVERALQWLWDQPNGVDVPRNLQLYNEAIAYRHLAGTQRAYRLSFPAVQRADACRQCGECEAKCPQHLPVMDWLAKVDPLLGLPDRSRPARSSQSPCPPRRRVSFQDAEQVVVVIGPDAEAWLDD